MTAKEGYDEYMYIVYFQSWKYNPKNRFYYLFTGGDFEWKVEGFYPHSYTDNSNRWKVFTILINVFL